MTEEMENTQQEHPETASAETQQPEQHEASTQGESQQEEYTSPNWKAAREKMNMLEEQNRQMAEKQRQYEEYLRQLQQPQKKKEDEFDINTMPDDYLIEAKDVRRLQQKDIERYKRLEERQILADMRDKYDDFKKVCSNDNIRKLKEADPYLAETVLLNPDPSKQWELVYKAIKREGIYKPKEEQENNMVADYNTSRPKVAAQAKSSQSRSVLGQAGAFSGVLTEEQKREYYKQAQKKISGE